MKKGTLRQILLLTDGCSNQGEDPAATAALAFEQGIAVNVIGILDHDESEESHGLTEVEEIALSGGGVSQLVYSEALSQTVQMVTKQAMNETLQGFVNQELKQILGKDQSLEDIEPEKRGEIVEVVEELGETTDLEVLILLDTSASMHHKLQMVKAALIDLSISLNARTGKNRFAIYSFPGKRKNIQKVLDWTPKLDSISSVFPKITSGGITPTGPALREAIYQFGKKSLLRSFRHGDEPGLEETGY
ncbi:VWA domain-containing protein [Oceanobacillus alkalisoli]|uniref:VWA domain-containing protein n=1 Tax=Oceanobacillus alkalisoli TaxID=2925113 RepID=UPI001F11AD12|nr:VWA domain-containing protein [Oceanobacillus alkalisoli]MCF3944457.1 VWA domain-containing protein [Oceanobacillus alkalisoli]